MAGRAGRRRGVARNLPRASPVIPSNAVVASAVRYPGDVARIYRGQTDWQEEAWRFYDITPELRFAAGWIGNALSRCVLEPAEVDPTGLVVKSDNAVIRAALQEFFAGAHGQAQMLASIGIHLTVVGEVYLVGRHVPRRDGLLWEVIGVNELKPSSSGAWMIDYQADNMQNVRLTGQDTVIRVHRPHPARRIEADSPVRALLGTLAEIESLTSHVFAQTTSRLKGSGILALPSSIEFAGSNETTNKAEAITKMLADVASAALANPGSAASQVPIVMVVADEAMDKLRDPIDFFGKFDAAAVDGRKAAIERLAVGMDMPPEVIHGMTASGSSSGGRGTGASHWTSWQIEEAAIKLHIEPLLEYVVNAVAVEYLRVVTKKDNAALLPNTTALKLQPDRSKEAAEAYDRGEINGVGYRHYTGLSEEYALDEEGVKKFLLRKAAGSSVTPEQVAYAMQQLGLTDFPEGTTAGTRPVHPGSNQPQAPSLLDHPAPRSYPQAAQIITPACEALVLRALERVGGRLRNEGVRPENVPAAETHCFTTCNGNAAKLLDGAWTSVWQVLGGIEGVDPAKVSKCLQAYVESLLATQQPHSREAMSNYVKLAVR